MSWPPGGLVDDIRRAIDPRTSPVALVFGSGLGGLADRLDRPWSRRADEMEGYPRSTVPGHVGRLLLGEFGGRDVWMLQGRVHLYEGYSAEEVSRPVRLLHALGVNTLILTNAAGSVDRNAAGPGDVVLCSDAISLFFRVLAAPQAHDRWRQRDTLVDPGLRRLAETVAREEGMPLRQGVLVGSIGPSYETAAEVRAWRRIGGTVASMSTVPEAVTAREMGMRVLIFSLVTNYGTGLSEHPLSHEEVVREADRAAGVLARLLEPLVGRV